MKTNKILISILALSILIVASFHIASALTIKDVATNPSQVIPGAKFSVSIDIKNNFGDDAENVYVSLNLANLPFAPGLTSQAYEEEITEGDDQRFGFDLIADSNAEGGNYKIPITITYKLGNETRNESSFISVTINSKPEFNLDSDSIILRNQKNSLDIKITNIGLTQAKFLEIELSSGNYQLLSASRVYIGDLASNDFDTASYTIHVADSGNINIPVTMTYRDSANKQYTETRALSLRAYSQQEAINLGLTAKSNTGTYVLIVILVIVAYIVYRIIRGYFKRRKKRQEM